MSHKSGNSTRRHSRWWRSEGGQSDPAALVDEVWLEPDRLRSVRRYLRRRHQAMPTDGELSAAWEQFFADCQLFVHGLLSSCGVPPAGRVDCAQEVWLEVVGRFPDFSSNADPRAVLAWLAKLTRTKAVDWFRRRRHVQAIQEMDVAYQNDPAEHAIRRERVELLREGLGQLGGVVSSSTILVIRMRCLEGRSVREVCERLSKKPQQVWDRQRRGLKKLQAICHRLRAAYE